MEQIDTIVVGAGPVGIGTALQLPGKVVIYERHTEYKRTHVLIIKYSTLRKFRGDLSLIRRLEEKGKVIKHTPPRSDRLVIRTNELQQVLKEAAIKKGIEIRYQTINSVKELPPCKLVVVADGARSRLRQELLGDDNLSYNRNFQHVVEFKYESMTPSDYFSIFNMQMIANNCRYFITEHVGKPNDNDITPITLRFFVDRQCYEELGEASFLHPRSPNDPTIPSSLAYCLNFCLNARHHLLGERYIPDSGKITKLQLGVYRSRSFLVQQRNRTYALVGDAAIGVPYFRALNVGFLCGTRLSLLVEEDQIEKYESYTDRLFVKELNKVMIKDMAVTYAEEFVRIYSTIPAILPHKILSADLFSQPHSACRGGNMQHQGKGFLCQIM
jgi:2-polyprenyl-6-methoxyphenol hydroxylase-like FAD-dependent oxidoreductase